MSGHFQPDKHQLQQHQTVRIPAAQIPVTGIRAPSYVIRQAAKQAKLPGDAGMDLYPTGIERVTKHGHNAQIFVTTGVVIHVGLGFVGLVRPRSSSIDRCNGGVPQEGIIDAGYQGEIYIRVLVPNDDKVIASVSAAIRECIVNQVAIAQFIIQQMIAVVPVEPAVPIPPSARGAGGFGSTDGRFT